ncbi:MAG: hypothetical protein HYY18_17940 [Planctomycetes bacterium]|nr:hypothetical protein [Planctomycetota bacterium]
MKHQRQQPTAQRIVERRAQKAVGLLKRLHRTLVEQMIDELIECEEALANMEEGGWSPYDVQKIEEKFLPRLPNLQSMMQQIASVHSEPVYAPPMIHRHKTLKAKEAEFDGALGEFLKTLGPAEVHGFQVHRSGDDVTAVVLYSTPQ